MQKKLSKPADDTGPGKRFNMQVTPEDIVLFKVAAKMKGLTMSAWGRITLREAASAIKTASTRKTSR